MSAQLEVVFTDSGNEIPSSPPPRRQAPKPSDTSTISNQDTSEEIETPDVVEAPAKKSRTATPDADDAKKGMDEFLEVLKESGQKVADVAGVGRIYSTIAELLGGINDTIKAFDSIFVQPSTPVVDDESTPPRETTATAPDKELDPSRAAPLEKPEAETREPTQTPSTPKSPASAGESIAKPVEEFGKIAPAAPEAATAATAETAVTATVVESVAAPAASAGAAIGGLAIELGPAALAVAGLTTAIVAGAAIIKMSFDAIRSYTDDLQGYSAEIGAAVANTEMRAAESQIRRADRIGPDAAAFENSYGKLESKMADLQTEILAILLKLFRLLEPLIPLIEIQVDLARANLAAMATLVDVALKLAKFDVAGAIKALLDGSKAVADATKDIAKDVNDLLNGDDENENDDRFMQQFMAFAAQGMPRHPSVPPPKPPPPPRRGPGGV